MIVLTEAEEREVLARREARANAAAGAYGSSPKLDVQRSALLEQLAELNEGRLAMGYGQLPSPLDVATIEAVQRVQQIGFSMKTADGDARPFAIPSRVAYEIVKALRGGKAQAPATGMAVPT
jgi:hypothetical protein